MRYQVPVYTQQSFNSRLPIRYISIEGPPLNSLNSEAYITSIRRAYKVLMSQNRTPYGVSTTKKEYTYFSPKNKGRARLPRSPALGRGIMVSGTKGGRGVRKPKVRDFTLKVNRKERIVALRRAFFFSFYRDFLQNRGHNSIDLEHPLVFTDFAFTKTSHLRNFFLNDTPLSGELTRSQVTRHRASRGRHRNRRIITRRGPLVLTSNDNILAVRNLAGVDHIDSYQINIRHLAPGGVPGRLLISTETTFIDLLENLDLSYEIEEVV